jgi:hypothetical protein
VVDVYAGAPQPKLAKAERYVAELDSMGTAAAVERMLAHKAMADQARFRDSVAMQETEITAAMKAMGEITGDLRKEYAPSAASVYQGLADLRARKGDGPGALAVVEEGRTLLVPLRPSVAPIFASMPRWYTLIGKQAPAMQATQLFNASNTGTAAPGKPSLLIFVTHGCAPLPVCYAGYATLKRIAAKYGDKVDVTLMTRTTGYYRNELIKPEAEMARVKEYFLEFLQLPGSLVVRKADFDKQDDGRLIVRSSPNGEANQLPGGILMTYIVDKAGRIRLVVPTGRNTEAIIDDVLQSLM